MTKVNLELQKMVRNLSLDDDGWKGSLAFVQKRHVEKIVRAKPVTQQWRMKERMKTVSVALVLCLNVGVDPPDVVKTQPCARMEAWIDPLSMGPQKALENIGSNLQRQYERWQPRARYKQSLDPCVDEVKKLCTSLRRNAKDERVLFHYNGHGVPKPTENGEIWVFNKTYTQYIPLSVYDLQTWMGSPSIYVYDCSNAGIIVESFKTFCHQREQELKVQLNSAQRHPSGGSTASGGGGGGTTSSYAFSALPTIPSLSNCIQLAACSAKELLPMNPELPADLFSACLTTPIKTALRWFVLQNTHKLVPKINLDMIDKIPGQLNDRRTMLGELNWIFTAITDTIAWNTLPRGLFQKLFRQDLLVASLFRNFLLAERIMRSYNCTPCSSPPLPTTYQHPMWQAWDLALDLCLTQLPVVLQSEDSLEHSLFFAEQLTAFQVWLAYGSDLRSPPEQLPIVLQVLLSQVHRLRALELLGRFLDLGPWAVNLALSVGIFPYVLKLLQSSARELRPLLVFIWAKILAVDSSCQTDLVKDNGHKYFLSVLADQTMSAEHRTLAAFVLAMIVNNYPSGQEAALQGNLISCCLEQLNDPHDQLRQWLALCLAKAWNNFDSARWCGVRDSAHEKLYTLLEDPAPEVRAAAVYALGTFICNSSERTDQANNIDHGVARTLLGELHDASPLVRKEMVAAFTGLVQLFESQFLAVAVQITEEDHRAHLNAHQLSLPHSDAVTMANSPLHYNDANAGMRRSMSQRSLKGILSPAHSSGMLAVLGTSAEGRSTAETPVAQSAMKRVASTSSMGGFIGGVINTIYVNVYKALVALSYDPHPEVAQLAVDVIHNLRVRTVRTGAASGAGKMSINVGGVPTPDHVRRHSTSNSQSAPSSPQTRATVDMGRKIQEQKLLQDAADSPLPPQPATLPRARTASKMAQNDDDSASTKSAELTTSPSTKYLSSGSNPLSLTELFAWSCGALSAPVNTLPADQDPHSLRYHEREFRCKRAAKLRAQGLEQLAKSSGRLGEQVFINKNASAPTVLKFHPYDPHLAIADRNSVSIWDWEAGIRLHHWLTLAARGTRTTSMHFMNTHDAAQLLTGSDDGTVRVWRHLVRDDRTTPELVTAWTALSDMLPVQRLGAGIVTRWEQGTGTLIASGDVKYIRLWDTQRESKRQDLLTDADSCVTSIDSDGAHLIVTGCADGSVRLFDRRLPAAESRVMTYREHLKRVVTARIRQAGTRIISADSGGLIKLWSVSGGLESEQTINAMFGLTSMISHDNAPVFAVGSQQQFIGVLSEKGSVLSTIKYHEGFMGQRIGPISCMAFHPYKMKLAAGSSDSFVSVYASAADSRKR